MKTIILWIPIVGIIFKIITKNKKDLIKNPIIEFIYIWYHLWVTPIIGISLYHHIFIKPIPLF